LIFNNVVLYPGQPVSRILSGARLRFTPEGFIPQRSHLGDHLSGLTISRQLVAANPGLECSGQLLVPARPCSWRGLPRPLALLPAPVVSYTTISPLPLAWLYVSVARSGRFPRPGSFPGAKPYGVRTFLCLRSDRPADLDSNDTIRFSRRQLSGERQDPCLTPIGHMLYNRRLATRRF
jgi:hypothetical protein